MLTFAAPPILLQHLLEPVDQIAAPIVRAKQGSADQIAHASHMEYCLIPGRQAERGDYEIIWHPDQREAYLDAIMADMAEQLILDPPAKQ